MCEHMLPVITVQERHLSGAKRSCGRPAAATMNVTACIRKHPEARKQTCVEPHMTLRLHRDRAST